MRRPQRWGCLTMTGGLALCAIALFLVSPIIYGPPHPNPPTPTPVLASPTRPPLGYARPVLSFEELRREIYAMHAICHTGSVGVDNKSGKVRCLDELAAVKPQPELRPEMSTFRILQIGGVLTLRNGRLKIGLPPNVIWEGQVSATPRTTYRRRSSATIPALPSFTF